MRRRLLSFSLALALALVGCDSDDPRDAATGPDAAAADGGAGADAGADAGTEDGGAGADAGTDAGADGGSGCPASCVPPEHATADCSSGACDFVCDSGWVRRGDGCIEALPCTPGLTAGPVRVTEDGNDHNNPAVAVSGDAAAVFWIQGGLGDNTRALNARFYDYPALTPRTDVRVIASGALRKTSSIEIVPISSGFAVVYDRIDHTTGTSRCAIDRFDRAGGRSVGSFTATGGSCVNFAFGGSDAGFALAYGVVRVDARRFDSDGALVSGTPGTRITGDGEGQAGGGNHVAFHPSRDEYRIAYVHPLGGGRVDLSTATLSSTGFRTTVDVTAAAGFDLYRRPELAYASGGYGLLFEGRATSTDSIERYLVPLDADGTATTPSPVALGYATRAALAAGPHELGVVVGVSDDISLRVFDLGGAPVGSPIDIATGPSHADWPDVAWAGDGFVVAYSDDVAGAGLDDIYLARACPAR